MKNTEKKVLILENLQSPFIHQAIIVLKDNAEIEEPTIILEAEKIVADFFPKYIKKSPRKSNRLLFGGFAIITLFALILHLF